MGFCGEVLQHFFYIAYLLEKRIQEEQDKACKCIYKYEEYRRKIRTLANENKSLVYQVRELEKKLESSNYTSDYTGDYLGFEETK